MSLPSLFYLPLPVPLELGPYIAARRFGGALKLPQQGPGCKSNFGIFGAQKKHLVAMI